MAFKKAEMRTAYLKAGVFGESGSGKTFSSHLAAIGLHRLIKSKRPVAMIDSEGGSDYLIERFQAAKIEFEVDRTRAFSTLCDDLRAAEKEYDILLVDSISHFWTELMNAWLSKGKKDFIELQDWGKLKREWNQMWALPFINSKLHIIVCGRAGNVYETTTYEDRGKTKKKTEAVDTRMKSEGEFAYEPSFMVELEQLPGNKHRATIRKDRFGLLNGKVIEIDEKTTFSKVFLPYIQKLNLGGEHEGIREENSEAMFADPDWSWNEMKRRKDIAEEQITGIIGQYFPTANNPQQKIYRQAILATLFNTYSWTEVQGKPLDELERATKIVKPLCLAITTEDLSGINDPEELVKWLSQRRDEALNELARDEADATPVVDPEDDIPLFADKDKGPAAA